MHVAPAYQRMSYFCSKTFFGIVLILCVLALLLVAHAASDSPPVQWTKIYGGEDGEWAYSLIQTTDGGFALAGASATYSWPERGYTNYSFLLIKTDREGEMQWNRTYGGDETDELAYSLLDPNDGGYVLAGVKQYSGTADGEFRIKEDFLLIKTTSEGVLQWSRTYGGPENERLYNAIATSDGGYLLVGYKETTVFPYYGDAWFVKTDADGNMQWNRTFGGEDFDVASCVIEVDEGYVMCGWTHSFGPEDFWLIKTDPLGNVVWNKTYGGQGQEWANCVVEARDGGYLLAGRTESFGLGGGDGWLVKTDSSGNMEWSKNYGTGDREHVQSVVQGRDGGYIFVGFVSSIATGNADVWVTKTDSSGNIEWNTTYGTGESDQAYCVINSDSGIVFAGETNSSDAGRVDVLLVKFESSATTDFLVWTIVFLLLAAVLFTVLLFLRKRLRPASDSSIP